MIQEPILIVDDELNVRSTLQEALIKHGYTADAVASGEQALECLAGRPYSVVLTDLNLPGGISGLELMAAIRQRQPETLCILVTAFATLDISIEALKRGASYTGKIHNVSYPFRDRIRDNEQRFVPRIGLLTSR